MLFSEARRKRRESKAMMVEVMGHIRAGKKVAAIKAYRNHTGLGLKESKAVVDGFCDNM